MHISKPLISVLYDRDGVLAVNKPYDIPTSGRDLDDSDAVQYWLIKSQNRMVWAVHQLDADTTGINLFVTEKRLVSLYQNGLADPLSNKIYLAVVHGSPEWESVECRAPIGYIDERSLGVSAEGKSAFSRFRKIDSKGDYSLIEAEIFTGRTHQIRIHLSSLGFPLVGEEWYTDQPIREHCRQALHAWKLNLHSPELSLTAPIPPDFQELLDRLGLSITE